ncbi:hypothetical protein GUITHDRAFT_142134 [Guillardia theta CCMP2712]|uniref:Uncharacterized protein n=1 Tax=Guillardia theta (strain CCMP2712) TaxID=905079 RepID=L1IZ79_GUITC|nr:hypothetical protein GUITHDRAFT_142134 [Guillardia theta CCMP2712]EKX41204.1 hypothetical protein GUITHDRAFT_142134 [Guillardia theta CCMP2712]|eukprot:XP_005828184.1 hypothetical protein GUITHDRAFT_142134 [Guillardia theta CCMP2712]
MPWVRPEGSGGSNSLSWEDVRSSSVFVMQRHRSHRAPDYLRNMLASVRRHLRSGTCEYQILLADKHRTKVAEAATAGTKIISPLSDVSSRPVKPCRLTVGREIDCLTAAYIFEHDNEAHLDSPDCSEVDQLVCCQSLAACAFKAHTCDHSRMIGQICKDIVPTSNLWIKPIPSSNNILPYEHFEGIFRSIWNKDPVRFRILVRSKEKHVLALSSDLQELKALWRTLNETLLQALQAAGVRPCVRWRPRANEMLIHRGISGFEMVKILSELIGCCTTSVMRKRTAAREEAEESESKSLQDNVEVTLLMRLDLCMLAGQTLCALMRRRRASKLSWIAAELKRMQDFFALPPDTFKGLAASAASPPPPSQPPRSSCNPQGLPSIVTWWNISPSPRTIQRRTRDFPSVVTWWGADKGGGDRSRAAEEEGEGGEKEEEDTWAVEQEMSHEGDAQEENLRALGGMMINVWGITLGSSEEEEEEGGGEEGAQGEEEELRRVRDHLNRLQSLPRTTREKEVLSSLSSSLDLDILAVRLWEDRMLVSAAYITCISQDMDSIQLEGEGPQGSKRDRTPRPFPGLPSRPSGPSKGWRVAMRALGAGVLAMIDGEPSRGKSNLLMETLRPLKTLHGTVKAAMNAAGDGVQEANEVCLRPVCEPSRTLARCGFLEEVCELWSTAINQLVERSGRTEVTREWCALRWEVGLQQEVGKTVYGSKDLSSVFLRYRQGIRSVVRSAVLQDPVSLLSEKAKGTGRQLAFTIRKHGSSRPITLVGFGFGASTILSALIELARTASYGLVDEVYLIGMPSTYDESSWREARGRFVNCYHSSDKSVQTIISRALHGLVCVLVPSPALLMVLQDVGISAMANGFVDYRGHLVDVLSSVRLIP